MNTVNQHGPADVARSAPSVTAGHAALNVLCVDDSEQDVLLIVEALRQGGHAVAFERVDRYQTLEAALDRREWDMVICDDSMPQFDGLRALQIVKQRGRDIPLIIVSGPILNEGAPTAMKTAAPDYTMKRELAQFAPAVGHELTEAGFRHTQRLAEVNLRSNEALLSSIINTAPDAILVIDESGAIEFVNTAVERMFGWKPLELIGKSMDILLVASQRASRALIQPDLGMGSGVTGYRHELDARRKDGSVFLIETMTSKMRSEGRVRYTWNLRDITERKHTEECMRDPARYDEVKRRPNRALAFRLLD